MSDKLAGMAMKWADYPTTDDLVDAAAFLSLLSIARVRLTENSSDRVFYQAKDLLRAARLPALPRENAGVAKWLKRMHAGEQIPVVLLLAGTLDRPLVIAEGYHRVSACWQLAEATTVGAFLLAAE